MTARVRPVPIVRAESLDDCVQRRRTAALLRCSQERLDAEALLLLYDEHTGTL